jgi:hypothetical protein
VLDSGAIILLRRHITGQMLYSLETVGFTAGASFRSRQPVWFRRLHGFAEGAPLPGESFQSTISYESVNISWIIANKKRRFEEVMADHLSADWGAQ